MIGNDVVDLDLAGRQSNWRRKGYLDKIFTPDEQHYILQAPDPDTVVWTLWTRKEAVYKIIRQQNGIRGFYPLRIATTHFENGTVCFDNQLFYTQTEVTATSIHTIALLIPTFDQVITLPLHQELFKIDEVPYVILDDKKHAVSKSHHGRFERVVGCRLSVVG
ncbi:4'-phosphopantetheinyl transferase family protein [Flavobacterium orientale]|uniref:4'-phosphopantetheinyl transferase domain-containing protein n=1 Tax=Flavobacterium orientale TaxID=1756020 RepID=A0A917DBK7_9FLAO|nr:4'-phosphopantetheinyl transferase superfamily protein [Flavobacterium orientale]GGD24082.1 hypothetical protein GCM10011343_12820 [Flavobacterium orientale]